ncbi:restriction endonuclease [Shewanella frigidimarina]|uniref:restriction endonuclease n=1 Tax=Shewanella frigidimarina TaxID=56812 RepID=UPI000F4DA434|nr:restriction endonuclease [Shewanella frigidimarina]RPA35258.1 restriction endonuclease [Shewanella frigidimarina]
MGVKGPEKIKEKLTACLDPKLLVDLAADLLFVKGHSTIRKTDGPGDGGRDLFSIDRNGDKLLVQCKFHEDCDKTSSSRELSELPMALIKFNYKKGIFITNGKISPQSKREYLDNYSHLDLTFIDGNDLAMEVIDSPLLKAVWFDGHDFHKISNSISFPILLREHNEDLPLIITRHFDDTEVENLIYELNVVFSNFSFTFKNSFFSTDCFEPYKAPEPLSNEEGGSSLFSFSEIIIEGLNTLADIDSTRVKISKIIFSWLGDRFDGITLRFGIPSLIAKDDSKIELNISPESFINTKDYTGKELDFYNLDGHEFWSGVNDARVTEAGLIRLYCHKLNVCLDYPINSRLAWKQQLTRIASIENLKTKWNKSIFALVEKYDEWPYSDIEEPDEAGLWIDNKKIICAWFHFSLLGWPSDVRSRNNDGLGSIFKLPDDAEWLDKLDSIKNCLPSYKNVELIEPAVARHMIAIIGEDPMGLEEKVLYHTGEVINYPEGIPSPILPNSRIPRLEIVFAYHEDTVVESDVIKLFIDQESVTDVECDIMNDHCHVRINLKLESTQTKSSSEVLNEVTQLAEQILNKLITIMPKECIVITREYWKKKYNLSLGIDWQESGKHYYGFTNTKTDNELMDFHEIMNRLTS